MKKQNIIKLLSGTMSSLLLMSNFSIAAEPNNPSTQMQDSNQESASTNTQVNTENSGKQTTKSSQDDKTTNQNDSSTPQTDDSDTTEKTEQAESQNTQDKANNTDQATTESSQDDVSAISEVGAKNFADDLLAKVYDNLKSINKDNDKIFEYFAEITPEYFALNYMAIFSGGLYLNNVSEQQKQQYIDLAKKYMILHYGELFRSYYQSYEYKVVGAEKKTEDEFAVNIIVESAKELSKQQDGVIDVVWKIKYSKKDNQFYIIDIVINNVSLLSAQRLNFESKIKNTNNNSFDALMTFLSNDIKSTRMELGLEAEQLTTQDDPNMDNADQAIPTEENQNTSPSQTTTGNDEANTADADEANTADADEANTADADEANTADANEANTEDSTNQ